MAISKLLPLLLLLISTSTSTADQCASPKSSVSSDLPLFHIYGKCSPFASSTPAPSSWFDTVHLKMAREDSARVSYLSSLVVKKKGPTSVPVASGQQLMQTANYVLRARLGTPAQTMYMVVDTSSDSAWVPCSGCAGCAGSTIFSPSNSTTYASMDCGAAQCASVHGQACTSGPSPCTFGQSYGGDSFTATLSQDSLTMAGDVIPTYSFGCLTSVTGGGFIPPQGLLGLGRGPMSLLSQTSPLYSGVFSYCLPSFKSYYFSGSLRLGPLGQPKLIHTTPLLRNPHRPSLYYVNLTSVSVGRVRVPVPASSFSFDPATGAGTVVDSGTVISRFVQPAYEAIRDEFRKQVGAGTYSSLGAYDTCFPATAETAAPTITLHLEGLDLALPTENTLIHSSATPIACLAMAAAPNNVNAVLNVIANLQQQNYRVLFDVTNSRVGFAREICG
ncbi:Aspartic proteinase nepenthesin-1 [Acorus calamus]|uniref:Aspartic proteinase nepenthesin-1 n=1 Tax=Acorus calamus TaxID=4465 RepID=A0AAV9CGI6_ACOCL|nr:Aspartic proteinase nepenthesin-1 [Acorus calamus]